MRTSPSGGRPWKIRKFRRMVSPAFRRRYSHVITSTLDQLSGLPKRQFGRLAIPGVDASDIGSAHQIGHSFLLLALLFQHFCLSSKRHGQGCHLARKEGVWCPTGDRLSCRGLLFQGLGGFAHARLARSNLYRPARVSAAHDRFDLAFSVTAFARGLSRWLPRQSVQASRRSPLVDASEPSSSA